MNLNHETVPTVGTPKSHADILDFITFTIADQLFGIPVQQIQDVFSAQQISPMSLAPPEITGSINLRGRIVIVMDVRRRLGLPPREAEEKAMNIVVDHGEHLYSLSVDSVAEILPLVDDEMEDSPPNLDPHFRAYSIGIHHVDGGLLVVLDVDKLLDFNTPSMGSTDEIQPNPN